MSRERLRIRNTDADNLVSNLRGEVGEIVTCWLILRHFMSEGARLRTDQPSNDIKNPSLSFVHLMADKVKDELIGRLSEIAEKKIGRLTFYFAVQKLGVLAQETDSFSKFIVTTRIREKRNQNISHKELPEKWSDHRHLGIPYRTLVKAVAMAQRLMKRFDRRALGPAAPYLWREGRKRRYQLLTPPRAAYMLLPHLNLSGQDRVRILHEEMKEGIDVWSDMDTTSNGQVVKVRVCKKWAILQLGRRLLPLDHYPLQELKSVDFGSAPDGPT